MRKILSAQALLSQTNMYLCSMMAASMYRIKIIVIFLVILGCASFSKLSAQNDSITQFLDKYTFVNVDQFPVFPGGNETMIKFISKNIVYPPKAYKKKIEGEVVVSFVVNKDGSLTDFNIEKGSLKKGCDKEALRVVKSMPPWIPGSVKGYPVRVLLKLPIHFSLKE